jgi:hypothetical protein
LKKTLIHPLNFNKISVRPKNLPYEVFFDSLKADCPSSVIWGNFTNCQVWFSINQGNGNLNFTDKNKFSAEIKDVQLSKFPSLSAHYIDNGTISIVDIKLDTDTKLLTGKIILTNISKTKSSNLAPSITGLPMAIKIDPININSATTDIQITFDSALKNIDQLSVDKIEVSSDMGTITLPSSVKFAKRRLESILVNFHPSALGLSSIKPFAQFICPPESLSTAAPLRFSFNGAQASCQIATN